MNDNTIKIYDTLSKKTTKLISSKDKKINLFVCGPTVYDYPHLGHAKTYTQFDGFVKYLRFLGYDVMYLQNITDIDDKIIQRAAQNKKNWKTLSNRFEKIYLEDMAALHNTAVDTYARATDHINEIVSQIQRLLEKGFAYRTDDGIYYEISKFPSYGKLSKRQEVRQEDALSRIDDSSQKRGWNDFCLWKISKAGEPVWETPLGNGRPGWHIEDTAITEKYFGAQYDIHGGAKDLIFPHHEAEIAQMEAISDQKPLVQHWMHTGFVNIGSVKMSKSLGNFTTIRDVLQKYTYRILRYVFLSSHYRSPLDFTENILEQAKNTLQRIDEFIFRIDAHYDDAADISEETTKMEKEFFEALNNDFNTPKAFGILFDFIHTQNTKKKIGKTVFEFFQKINTFFDFITFEQSKQDEFINSLLEERAKCRQNKNFSQADTIRDRLIKMGVKIYDTSEGTKYRQIK